MLLCCGRRRPGSTAATVVVQEEEEEEEEEEERTTAARRWSIITGVVVDKDETEELYTTFESCTIRLLRAPCCFGSDDISVGFVSR